MIPRPRSPVLRWVLYYSAGLLLLLPGTVVLLSALNLPAWTHTLFVLLSVLALPLVALAAQVVHRRPTTRD